MSNAIVILMLTIVDNNTHSVSARQQRMTQAECTQQMNVAKATKQSNEFVFGGCVPLPAGSK